MGCSIICHLYKSENEVAHETMVGLIKPSRGSKFISEVNNILILQASASASTTNSEELGELNHKLAQFKKDRGLLKKQMDQAQGK